MKVKYQVYFLLLFFCVLLTNDSQAQFRNSRGQNYPYATEIGTNDVFILGVGIGTAGNTNKNVRYQVVKEQVEQDVVLHGSNNITAGTISSNRLDATAYAAFLGGGSGSAQTNISYTAVTNAPWITNNDTRSLTLPLANSGSTNLTSTNTVLKGTTEFRTPDGNDVVTADLINDADNHLLSFDFSPGSPVLIGGTGVVATAFYGGGSGLTGIHGSNNIMAGTISTNRMDATAYAAFIGGGASQTPWTTNINAAAFSLTNLGSLVQTGASGSTLLSQTVKRGTNISHKYESTRLHYGGTNDLFWTTGWASFTNTFDPIPNSYDHAYWWGYNSPNSYVYNTNEPSLQYAFEDNYVTLQGVRQMEHYINFLASSTNTHPRPWGWSFILNGTNKPTVLHTWSVEEFNFNASNGNPAIIATMSSTNGAALSIVRDSKLSFQGNTMESGQMIVDRSGVNLVGEYQYGMPVFGGVKSAASNSVVFLPKDLAAGNVHLLLGQSNAYSGFRYHSYSNRLEYMNATTPQTLAAATWRPFNDFSKWQLSYDLGATIPLAANTGDFTTLGYFTNNNSLGVGLLEVTATLYGASADNIQRWLIPVTRTDAQGSASTWREVLPTIRAGRDATNFVSTCLDVAGNGSGTAMNLRLRRAEAATAYNIIVTINVWSDGLADTKFVKITGSTGTGATVAGYYRHIGLTQINGNVGIGTNSPVDALHVHGTVRGVTGFTSDGANDTMMPTNTPTDGYALTAAGTAGYTKWAAVSGGSGNGAWRTNALAGVSEPNLSPYDLATAAIVIPQDVHFLASNGVSSRIVYPNGNAFAEFPLDSGFELNEPGGQTTIKVASSAAGGYSLINTNNDEAIGWEDVAGVRMPLATTTTMVVTNLVSPFGQLLSTGNATNYTIDFNTSDKQSITATGNVAFLKINNISNGAMKRFYITNVFWGTSNINVLMPTNCLVVTTNSGGPAAIGGGGSTNWVMTVTNDAKLSIECHGTSMRTLVWYLRLLQP